MGEERPSEQPEETGTIGAQAAGNDREERARAVPEEEYGETYARSPYVRRDAATDGALRLLIVGDEQAASWGELAVSHLQQRLSESGGDWAQVEVELRLETRAGWTAADAWNFLESGGWDLHRPELVLLALGWYDAARARANERPARDPATQRLAGLRERAVFEDRAMGEHDFYLRRALEGLEGEHLSPQHHLELLDGIALRGAERGAAVLYVEQPARHDRMDRRVFPTTAARPQPWLGTVLSLERRDDVEALFLSDSPIALSAQGAAHLGRSVGLGLAPAVLGIGRGD